MEPSRVVTNASPLIYLSILNRISLLGKLFSEVYLPEAVYKEVVIRGRGQPGAKETQAAIDEGWLHRITVKNRTAVDGLLDELHLGEAEAIVLARELDTGRVILDDRAARSKASLMGLWVTGTIGILLLAKDKGVVGNIQEDLDSLRQHNFRISPDLYVRLVRGT